MRLAAMRLVALMLLMRRASSWPLDVEDQWLKTSSTASPYRRLLSQNFETTDRRWEIKKLTRVESSETPSGGVNRILRATYKPDKKGTERISSKFDLSRATRTATLSYDLKFSPDWEFVKSGKLHGLGGGTTTTGCSSPDPKGWSVRVTWKDKGPKLYVYHQDRKGRCGDDFLPDPKFPFERNRWYRIDVQVQLNSEPKVADGQARLFVDGKLVVETPPKLRLTGHSSVEIDTFIFSTFYGGSDPSYAPKKINYAWFDNFAVHNQAVVTGMPGKQCEFYQNGIYNPVLNRCCPDTCGECGSITQCRSRTRGGQCCTGMPMAPPPPTAAPATPAPTKYELVLSGTNCNRITSDTECEAAAAELGLRDTTVSDDRQSRKTSDPPWCYFESGSLKMNEDGSNTGPCTSSDKCLCSKAAAPGPSMAAREAEAAAAREAEAKVAREAEEAAAREAKAKVAREAEEAAAREAEAKVAREAEEAAAREAEEKAAREAEEAAAEPSPGPASTPSGTECERAGGLSDRTGSACCPTACGQCGGRRCRKKGPMCCVPTVKATKRRCAKQAAPCVISGSNLVQDEEDAWTELE